MRYVVSLQVRFGFVPSSSLLLEVALDPTQISGLLHSHLDVQFEFLRFLLVFSL